MKNADLNMKAVRLALVLIASVEGPALADECAAVKDAVIAQTKVPYAASTVMALGSAPATTTQSISTGGRLYFQVNGTWQSTPHDAQKEVDKANAASKTGSCTHESDATVNGESTAVFLVHYKTEHSESDNRLWISKSTGLPLKTDVQFKDGIKVSIAFRYDNIQPPVDTK
jgi:outer membrane lipoprotein-sorting protein